MAENQKKSRRRRSGPRPATEREKRRRLVLDLLHEGRPIGSIYRDVAARFEVTERTIRADLRWASGHVAKDLDAAVEGEPVRIYHSLDALAEMAAERGRYGAAVRARQAQLALLGYRASVKWRRSLQQQQLKLAEAKTELAKQQLRLAERDRKIEEERKALLAARPTRGGIPILQKPDQEVLNRMSRYLITGRTELEGWILSHSQDVETESTESLPRSELATDGVEHSDR